MKSWTTKNGYKITRILAGRSNVFLIEGKGKNILVDTSPGYRLSKLYSNLKEMGISNLDYLILTHTHFDHAANAARIREDFNARVIVHKDEARYLETGENILPRGTNPFSAALVRIFKNQFISIAKYEPCRADLLVDSDFCPDISIPELKIINTPGHTQGSVSIIVDDEVALTGDAMFGIFFRSIFPPFAGNNIELIKSWGKLLETDARVFLPSHGSENKRALVKNEFERYVRHYKLTNIISSLNSEQEK
jgi:hydroxyacylglutathione hydrolase